MPHLKRFVEPVLVSRTKVDPSVQDELECVTNNTLANVIRELSSLSRFAEDMFRELSEETTSVFKRGNQLQRRIEDVREKVKQLNPNVDVLNLQDIHLQKPFKSSIIKEQQVLSRSTVPRSILEMYSRCDTPPALDKLDQFREDGKSSMKFYTDPSYFAELWAIEMGKQIQENKKLHEKKRKGRERQRPNQQSHIREAKAIMRDRHRQAAMGEEFRGDQDPNTVKQRIDRDQEEAIRQQLQQEEEYRRQSQRQLLEEEARRQSQRQLEETRRKSQRPPQPPNQLQHHQIQQQQQRNNISQRHHTEQIAYEPGHIAPYTHIVDGYTTRPGIGLNHNHHSPQQITEMQIVSPDKVANGYLDNRKPVTSPNRPQAPPPAPPSVAVSKDKLPSPPTPPAMEYLVEKAQPSVSPQTSRVMKPGPARSSPVRQGSRHESDLPPPPPSPPIGQLHNISHTSVSVVSLPPPPSPPVMDTAVHISPTPSPPPPPLTPPQVIEMNGDRISVASSSTGAPSVTETSRPLFIGADRSALLKEIIQVDINKKRLKKVEASENQKQLPSVPGMLDVQAIMDRAIEMRRKVIEISDSGGEESDDNDWVDSD